MSKSLFITFEGGEGAGKTTQINRLAQTLSNLGYKVVTTREPGGTPEGEKIRDLIVQRDAGDWVPMAEVLLFFAARTMLVEKVIRPALNEGKIVICDRFSDSTIAYQGYGHGVNHHDIEKMNILAMAHLKPDVTFILDLDPEIGLERSDRRIAAEQFQVKQREDRYEKLDLEFHQRIRRGFLNIAERESQRCFVIDASEDIDTVSGRIADIIRDKIE